MLKGDETVFEYQILTNYILINIFGYQKVHIGFLTQTPLVLIGTYL